MSEELARKFHETYERLAPSFGYETRKETKDFAPTSANGMLMIAVCSEVLGGLSSKDERLRKNRFRQLELVEDAFREGFSDGILAGDLMDNSINADKAWRNSFWKGEMSDE